MIASLPGHEYAKKLLPELVTADKFPAIPVELQSAAPLKEHLLLYMIRGEAEIVVNGQAMPLARHTLCIYSPGTRLKLNVEQAVAADTELVWVSFQLFQCEQAEANERRFVKQEQFPVQGSFHFSGEEVQSMMSGLVDNRQQFHDSQLFIGKQQLLDLLLLLIRYAGSMEKDDAEQRLWSTVQYMQQYYMKPLRISTLAESANFHPTYFSQLFKQLLKKTPMAYLTDLRINKAKELLLETEQPVASVAANVGFADEFYFSRRFKESSRCTPSTYKPRCDMSVVSLSAAYSDHLYTLGHPVTAAQTHARTPLDTHQLILPKHKIEPWRASRELFLAVQPELILCKDNVEQVARANINDIAPIVSIPWKTLDVCQHLQKIAQLVDRQQQAGQWLERYELQCERLRKKWRAKAGFTTVAICMYRNGQLRLYGARNMGHVFYRSLQLQPPQLVREQIERYPTGTHFTWMEIAAEEIMDYEADILFIAAATEDERRQVAAWQHELSSWRRHPAVAAGRVYDLDLDKWLTYAPHGIEEQLAEVERMLELGHF